MIHLFHDLSLHDDESEDGNVYGIERVSIQRTEGRRVTEFPPKMRQRDICVMVSAFSIVARHISNESRGIGGNCMAKVIALAPGRGAYAIERQYRPGLRTAETSIKIPTPNCTAEIEYSVPATHLFFLVMAKTLLG